MIEIKARGECSTDELNKFVKLVEKGDEVDRCNLSDRVKRAQFLAFSYDESNNLVGVGAIKQPNTTYRNSVFSKAKSNHPPNQYDVELGWIYIEEDFRGRGIGKTIVRELLEKIKDKKVYATTRTDNDTMKHILKYFKFHESGEEYKSTRGKHSLVLFVRD
jgi:RimJ/RimL family protein N-acetyltransferase